MYALLTTLIILAGAAVAIVARLALREMGTMDAHGDPIDRDEQP